MKKNNILYNKIILRCFKEANKFSLNKRNQIISLITDKEDNLLRNIYMISHIISKENKNENVLNVLDIMLYQHFDIRNIFLDYIKNNNIYDIFINEYLKNPYQNNDLDKIHICDFLFNIISEFNPDIDMYFEDSNWNRYLMKLINEYEKNTCGK